MGIHRETTMKRKAIVLGLAAAWSTTACDPAKTGDYHGTFPDPPSIEVPSGVDLASFDLDIARRVDYRRWTQRRATYDVGGSGPRALVFLWPSLVAALDAAAKASLDGPGVVVGTVVGAPEHVFIVNTRPVAEFQPSGPSGPAIPNLAPGFHVYRRSCTSGEGNRLHEDVLSPKLSYDGAAAAQQVAGVDPILEACGLYVPPTFDLGAKVASIPIRDDGTERSLATDMAWAPTSDSLYLLAGELAAYNDVPNDDVQILHYDLATRLLTRAGLGGYLAPLEVATGGTSLLVNTRWDRIRLPLQGSAVAAQGPLLPGIDSASGRTPMGILSPDGNTLAIEALDNDGKNVVRLIDVASGSISRAKLAEGAPLAWDPSGTRLLVLADAFGAGFGVVSVADGTGAALPVDPTAPSVWDYFYPWLPARDIAFWSAGGPKVLIQGEQGAQIYDFQTFKTTRLVEPNLVAPPSAPVDVVIATEQVFAWSMFCQGPGETSCTSELRRLDLATGAIDVVARADGALLFAVSPDGGKLALAYKDGLYLKTLPR
jgi:hypothetical protein